VALDTRPGIGPIVDCNVHLWDQRDNPVFWLSDRTVVRDMLGDYDSLPDSYTLSDYRRETSGYDVRGVINLLRFLRRRAGHVVLPHRGALVCPGRRLNMPGVNLSRPHGADRSGWR
jgi:hypothetical protein